jgi:hypothetical protein
VWGKQTYSQLADSHRVGIRTVQNWIDSYKHPETYPYQELIPQPIHLVIDAFYWKRGEGVIVFRSHNLKRCLFWFDISYESIACYQAGVNALIAAGWDILSITVDGRKGVLNTLKGYAPIQLCHFHQLATVTRYLSKNPRLQASIELKKIASSIGYIDPEKLDIILKTWHQKHHSFLKERTYHPSGKWSYTHKRVRSCYYSLSRNMVYLFTYRKDLKIPNTTNTMDGYISHLRTLHRVHRGTILRRRRKITEEVLRGKPTQKYY